MRRISRWAITPTIAAWFRVFAICGNPWDATSKLAAIQRPNVTNTRV